MAGHAQLKFVMTECSKTQIRLMQPKWSYLREYEDLYYKDKQKQKTYNMYFLSINHKIVAVVFSQKIMIFYQTLRLLPYFMCANSEGSGETAQMRRLTWAFTGHLFQINYCNYPKFSDRQVWIASVDPDQIAALFTILYPYDIASESVMKPCIKNNNPLVD